MQDYYITHRMVGIWQRPYSVVAAPPLSSCCTCTTSTLPTCFTETAFSRNFSIESERIPSAAADLGQMVKSTPNIRISGSCDDGILMLMIVRLS